MFFVLLDFSWSLASLVITHNHTKCISLNNQQYMTQPILINLHPIAYTKGLCYYLSAVNLDRYIENHDTLNYLYNRVCVPNNFSVFNMIMGKNECRILTKHISYECKCKFNSDKCKSNQKWNNDKCRCECKNPEKHHTYEKY